MFLAWCLYCLWSYFPAILFVISFYGVNIVAYNEELAPGSIICRGRSIKSEVVYWKPSKKDLEYESPITPHHHEHADIYLSFEYDHGGFNNIRMGIESLIVATHAMGRTLVLPPLQHIYLLAKKHRDEHEKEEHNHMGFEDFYDINTLKAQRGFHVITMEEFLLKEAVPGKLKGIFPPNNNTKLCCGELWKYLSQVADVTPKWFDRFLAFPSQPGEFNLTLYQKDIGFRKRFEDFRRQYQDMMRNPVYYNKVI